MGKFIFTQTEIPGVVVIEPQVFGDDRGYFMETYQKDQFAEAGIDKEFVQDNQSRSTRGVLRGLHFQKNHTQGKLVRVTKGEVYDVAVDCRPRWWGRRHRCTCSRTLPHRSAPENHGQSPPGYRTSSCCPRRG